MTAKKYLAILTALLMILVSAGCTPTTSSDQKKPQTSQEEQQQKQESSTSDKSQQKTATVCVGVGLGDPLTKWEAEHGHAFSQGDTLKVFNNGTCKVVFDNDVAVTMTFVSKKGEDPVSANMLPQDGVKQSESSKETGGLTMTTEKWHSDALAAAIPSSKGNYTIMKNKKGKAYTEVVVDCTPNLSK